MKYQIFAKGNKIGDIKMQVDGEYEARAWMIGRIESITGKLDIRWDLCSSAALGEHYTHLHLRTITQHQIIYPKHHRNDIY